jgi:hypothetical protein
VSTVSLGEFNLVLTEFPDRFRIRLLLLVEDGSFKEIAVFEAKGSPTEEGRKEDILCWLKHNAPRAQEYFERLISLIDS